MRSLSIRMDFDEEIRAAAGVILDKIRKHNFVRIFSHYDADGLAAAGIMCNVLFRMGIPFHTSIVPKLSPHMLHEEDGMIFLCDMGTAHINMIWETLGGRDVVVIDHHEPPVSSISAHEQQHLELPQKVVSLFDMERSSSHSTLTYDDARTRSALIHINPVLAGDDDTSCAASLTYMVARYLTEDGKKGNIDLAGLAIVGALGDYQEMNRGINNLILEESLKEGVISTRKGLKLGDGVIKDVLLYATDPYTELTGYPDRIEKFLQDLGLDAQKKMSELSEEEHRKIASALLSSHTSSSDKKNENTLFGTIYILHEEVVKNSYDLMRIIDTCGRFGKGGIGIALCLRDNGMLDEALRYLRKFQVKLITELKRAREDIHEMSDIYYFYVRERGITGTLAGVLARYIFTDKPVIVLNRIGKPDDETKVSARCGSHLKGSVDLARAIEIASKNVGGFGGGHPTAAGASIPAGTEDEFLSLINQIIGEQRKQFSTKTVLTESR